GRTDELRIGTRETSGADGQRDEKSHRSRPRSFPGWSHGEKGLCQRVIAADGPVPLNRWSTPGMKWVLLLCCALAGVVQAGGWRDSPEVTVLFGEAGLDGTFVVFDPRAETFTGHDEARATIRFIPASTFKIPNSLIGLASGAVASADEVLPYGGQPQPFPQWEKDMSLREAIPISNVPIYQTLARRIGLSRMQEYVTRLDYGN